VEGEALSEACSPAGVRECKGRRATMRSFKTIVLIWVSLFLLLGLSFAQRERSSIAGRVGDASGAVVPGTDITVTNRNTGVVYNTQTTGDGIYIVVSSGFAKNRDTAGCLGLTEFFEPSSFARGAQQQTALRNHHRWLDSFRWTLFKERIRPAMSRWGGTW